MKNNFGAAKMFHIGFWIGAGMFVSKAVCTVFLGKLAVKATVHGMKKSTEGLTEKLWDSFEKVVEKKMEETDPKVVSEMEKIFNGIGDDIDKMDDALKHYEEKLKSEEK